MDRLIKYIFIVNFCLMATMFTFNAKTFDYTVEVRDVIFGFFTLLLFVLIAVKAADDPDGFDWEPVKRMIFPAFGLYFLAVLFSIINSVNTSQAVYGAAVTFCMIVFLFEAAYALKDETAFLKSAVLIAIGLGIFYVYQFFKYPGAPARRIGTMGNMNPNSAAFFLLLMMIIYFVSKRGLRPLKKKLVWLVPAAIAAGLCIFAIVSLRSRAVWLATGAAVFIISCRKIKYFIPAAAAMIITAGLIYHVKGPSVLSTKSLNQRKDLWKTVIMQSGDRPMGIGAGCWMLYLPRYARFMEPDVRGLVYRGITFSRPHNEFMTALSETGWVGFGAFVSLFAFVIYYARRKRVLLAMTAGFMIVAFFSYPMTKPFHRMVFICIAALAMKKVRIVTKVKKKKRPPNFRLPAAAAVIVGAGLLFCLYDFYIRFDTSCKCQRIYTAMADRQYNTVLFETMRISPLATVDACGIALLSYRADAYFLKKEINESFECYKKALKYAPNHLLTRMNVGSCYVLKGEIKEAQKWYGSVKEMYPDFGPAERGLRTAEILTGKYYGLHVGNRRN